MTDNKFVDLIFEPDSRASAEHKHKYKLAYQSFAKNPQQLFALFTDRDVSAAFFSTFEIYGKQLAILLDDLPKYFRSTSEQRLRFGKGDLSSRLLEEIFGAFLFSLLANDFPDAASQQPMADIVMAIIKLSRPGGALRLLGEKLGEIPLILNRLIGHGHIGKLSKDQPALFESITSNDTTLGVWAGIVANYAGQYCPTHYENSRDIRDWEKMQQFLQSFPCDTCPTISDARETPVPRHRNFNPHGMNSGISAFDSLLGQRLGPWKVVVSGRALRDLKEAAYGSTYIHTISLRKCIYLRSLFLTVYGPTQLRQF